MNVETKKPRVGRRVKLLAGAAILGAAGLGSYLAMSGGKSVEAPIHLTSATVAAPAAAAPAVDPGGAQSQVQDTSGGPDSPEATAEATGAEADGPGGWADP